MRDLNDGDNDDSGTQTWTPPAPLSTIPLPMDEDVAEVLVYSMDAGPVLVGAIELVSPANKDRPASRQVFVDKCAAYLHSGIGLALVDIVTNRQANLHDQLWRYLNSPTASPLEGDLYATAYRPIQQDGKSMLQVWASPLALDSELPVLPLWLRNGPCVPIDLEKTYQRTCREQRIRLAT